jgi:lysophospholipase L1-like esterase
MISMVRAADTSGGTRIVLITPPPVNTHKRAAALAARNPPQACDREFSVTKQYAEAVLAVAASEHVAAVDVWNAMYDAVKGEERQLDRFLHDGLHLNQAGYHVRSTFWLSNVFNDFFIACV